MTLAITPHSFAAASISVLFWWTVASPAMALALAAFAGRRPRLRLALVIAIVAGPLIVLMPLTAMHGGPGALAAGAAAAVEGAALVLAAAALVLSRRGRSVAARPAAAAIACAVVGGMLGTLALVTTFILL